MLVSFDYTISLAIPFIEDNQKNELNSFAYYSSFLIMNGTSFVIHFRFLSILEYPKQILP